MQSSALCILADECEKPLDNATNRPRGAQEEETSTKKTKRKTIKLKSKTSNTNIT